MLTPNKNEISVGSITPFRAVGLCATGLARSMWLDRSGQETN
jgi:hypothetical protein